jgi:hypothetical protein
MPDLPVSPLGRGHPLRGSLLRLPALLGVGLLVTGCGLGFQWTGLSGGSDEAHGASAPASEVDEGSTSTRASEGADSGPESAPPAETLLAQGQALLIAGRHAEAVPALEAYLVVGTQSEHRLHATWALALLHLIPESPVRDQGKALPYLDRVRAEHPASIEAVTAGLLQGMIRDLARSRATVNEQEATIDELNKLVEQLKQIDLNRRSGGRDTSGWPPRP